MKKYFINNFVITKLNNYLKECYKTKYLITFNNDIVGFANTLKQAKNTINQFIKEL